MPPPDFCSLCGYPERHHQGSWIDTHRFQAQVWIDRSFSRVMAESEAIGLSGKHVGEPAAPLLPSPEEGQIVRVTDAGSGRVFALITRLPADRLRVLRQAVEVIKTTPGAVLRQKSMSQTIHSAARVFGSTPKRPVAGFESCRGTTASRDYPEPHAVLTELADYFGKQFGEMMPEQAVTDRGIVNAIKPDWFMSEHALWTSGVINRMATLPYHRDRANLHTWSAMPTLRFKLKGGNLHVPEYGFSFPCRDGDVTWFAGRDLTHGVTSLHAQNDDSYRYSVVYYATASMVHCGTYAQETAQVRARRTVRERRTADGLRAPTPS